jgi:hypothetical protein
MAIIALPLDKVLQLVSMLPRVQYSGDLIFCLAINFHRKRWRLSTIRNGIGMVGLEEGDVKDWMDKAE